MSIPIPDPDPALVDVLWALFASTNDVASDVVPVDVFSFGDSQELADSLLALVTDGPKRATAGAIVDYEAEGIELPRVGDFAVVCDGNGIPQAVIETTDVLVGPLSSVDDVFAWEEGEGDRTRPDWLRSHTAFFRRSFARLDIARGATDYVSLSKRMS
jgi:uncharacterized protein YhfF